MSQGYDKFARHATSYAIKVSTDVADPVDVQLTTAAEAALAELAAAINSNKVDVNPGLAGAQIGTDQPAAFANNALVNTQVVIDITKPTTPAQEYALSVYNPSTVTDLTIKVLAAETALGGATRYAYITEILVAKGQTFTGTTVDTYLKLLHGVFAGTDLRLIVSNNTALGAAEGFTAQLRLREVSN